MSFDQSSSKTDEHVSEEKKLEKKFPLPEPPTIVYYFLQQQLVKLGKRLQVRQIALATAQVYLLRFYRTVNIRHTNPYLMLTTAFYLACKTEECPQHIRTVTQQARDLWPDCLQAADMSTIAECEFVLLQELEAQLIVSHPYVDLIEVKDALGLTQDETTLIWHTINDAHATTMPLRHTPRTIAAAAISLIRAIKPSGSGQNPNSMDEIWLQASAREGDQTQNGSMTKEQKLVQWLAQGGLNLEAVMECSQELISLHVALEKYDEHECKRLIGTLARARGISG